MGRLALRMPPRGSKTDIIPRGTPTPGVLLALCVDGERSVEGDLQVKSVEPWANTTERRTELMMHVLFDVVSMVDLESEVLSNVGDRRTMARGAWLKTRRSSPQTDQENATEAKPLLIGDM